MSASMTAPSSGGLNQRERTNNDSFLVNSSSPVTMPYLLASQMTGFMNHLLQLPALASGASSMATSAFSSHLSRSALIGRSWQMARASMAPLMPPADAPAMMSTPTRSSSLRLISRSRSK